MTKPALKKVETKEAPPSGTMELDGTSAPLEAATVKRLIDGWSMKRQIEQLQEALDQINAELAGAFECGARLVVPGVCAATVVCRDGVTVADAERLRAVLGFRFDDLVTQTVTYKAEEKLKQMAADADEPLAPAIRACLKITSGRALTWRAAK